MKHKHYDCIVAWAEGKQIEVKHPCNNSWWDAKPPSWDLDYEYRIKPEPVWFGLTGTEIRQLKDIHIPMYSTPTIDDYFNFYRAIEDALKDKNTTQHLQHDK